MQRTQGATYLWMGRSHIHSRGRVVFFVALYCCDAVHIDAGKVCCNCNLGHGSHITYSVVDDLGIPCLVRRARHSPSLVLFIIIVDLHRRKVPWFWKNLLILSRATTWALIRKQLLVVSNPEKIRNAESFLDVLHTEKQKREHFLSPVLYSVTVQVKAKVHILVIVRMLPVYSILKSMLGVSSTSVHRALRVLQYWWSTYCECEQYWRARYCEYWEYKQYWTPSTGSTRSTNIRNSWITQEDQEYWTREYGEYSQYFLPKYCHCCGVVR